MDFTHECDLGKMCIRDSLGAASRALVDSSLSIAEIGYDCGFNNLSNFNRIFKKKKGVTPKECRDNYRKNKTII